MRSQVSCNSLFNMSLFVCDVLSVHTGPLVCLSVSCTGLLNTGWLRLVGSIKVQVSFAEYRLFYRALAKETFNSLKLQESFVEYNLFCRALLQKRPIIFKEPTNRSYPIVYIHIRAVHICTPSLLMFSIEVMTSCGTCSLSL